MRGRHSVLLCLCGRTIRYRALRVARTKLLMQVLESLSGCTRHNLHPFYRSMCSRPRNESSEEKYARDEDLKQVAQRSPNWGT